MNTLDLIIIAAVVGAGVGGYRIGFVTRVASWIGMAAGIIVAARFLPTLLRRLDSADQITLVLIAVGTLLAGAFFGQAIGLVIGSRLHTAIPQPARTIDRIAGALAGAFGVLVALWLLLPTMSDVTGWMSEQARSSLVAGVVHDTFPDAPDTLQALRQLVGEDQFPRVFEALDPAPDLGPPPASTGISAAVADRVVPSTVKVEGNACQRIQDGSGFVVGPDLVATNAHVVAGEDSTTVQRTDGSTVRAIAVAFDSQRDLAILRVTGIGRAPLPIGTTDVGGKGGVFGHPGGGPLKIRPFQVADKVKANGRDIYDRSRTQRDVLILSSDLHPGDSGAPVIDPAGSVVGVAFAIAPDRPGVAYALATSELRAVLSGDLSHQVDTGPCLS
jgi:S1-C subfamily serine protease